MAADPSEAETVMASHGQHHSVHTSSGMPLEEMAMQQPMPIYYTQQALEQAQELDQMLIGGGGYRMPASQLLANMQMQQQLHAQMQSQFQEHMQPQLQEHMQPQLQEHMQPQLQGQIQPQLQTQMNLEHVHVPVQQQVLWDQQQEVQQVKDFKNNSLPLARIKKIMKADPGVQMIALESSVVFAKACEMFILDLTERSWGHTVEQNKRRTLQKDHVTGATYDAHIFDFLHDTIP